MHERTDDTGRAAKDRANSWNERHGVLAVPLTSAQTNAALTKRSLGQAIADRDIRGPYVDSEGAGGMWHKSGHQGPLDCTGCAMEHLVTLLPE